MDDKRLRILTLGVGRAIDNWMAENEECDHIEYCVMFIDTDHTPLKSVYVSSIPREAILELWKHEIDGSAKISWGIEQTKQ